jgi:isopenicillin N synthase-like dioxygenase
MTHTIRDGDVAGYADYDNRVLARPAGVERHQLDRLPIIDVSPFIAGGSEAERRRVARELRQACIDIGFFYITGHGIPASELDELLERGRRFFEQPLEEKMKIHQSESRSREGFWTPGGLAKNAPAADIKERFQYNLAPPELVTEAARRRTGDPRWPDMPGFEAFIRSHVEKRATLARQLVRAFALSLELSEDYFDDVYRNFNGSFLYNYYPPIDPAQLKPGQWSFSPHTDYGMFTILSQDELGGLQTRNSAGEWIDVPPVPGTFVVNVGDTLQMWTNDVYVSTLHRAANTYGKARISAVFFTEPQEDTHITCLPSCQSADNPPRYEPIVAGDYTRMLIEQAHRTGRPGVSKRTAERFTPKA